MFFGIKYHDQNQAPNAKHVSLATFLPQTSDDSIGFYLLCLTKFVVPHKICTVQKNT